MSGQELPIYRLPMATASSVGRVRVITDRNGRHYINGSRVATTSVSGDFQVLELENGERFFVKARDYARLPGPRGRSR